MSPLTLLAIQPPGMMELMVVLVIVLILFGPKALPSLGKAMGSAMREFKSAANKFNEELESEVEADAKRKATPTKAAPAGTAPTAPPTDSV